MDPGGVDYLEVENRTDEPSNLHKMSIQQHWECDKDPISYTFLPDAIVLPGERYRVIDDDSDLRMRESVTNYDMCQQPGESGWVALCAGPCDLVSCANVVDYVEVGSAPPAPPTCASFSPVPLDVASLGASDSVVRTAFASSGADGTAADWRISPATRD